MFAFTDPTGNSIPIAVIDGGRYNKNILYLINPEDAKKLTKNGNLPFDYTTLLHEDFMKNMTKRLRAKEYQRIYKMMKKDRKPIKPDSTYDEAMKIRKKKLNKEIVLIDGDICPIPNPFHPMFLYVAGPNGAGKSTVIGKWCKQYHKLFPDHDIWLFARDDEDDPAFETLPLKQVEINDDLLDNPIEPKELTKSMVIFDDTSTIRDRKLNEAIELLKNDLLEVGRKKKTYICVSNHLLNDNRKTKTILNECHVLCFFPGSGNFYSINYCLQRYFGFSRATINKIMKLPSRWVMVVKSYPQYVLYSKGCFFVSDVK